MDWDAAEIHKQKILNEQFWLINDLFLLEWLWSET